LGTTKVQPGADGATSADHKKCSLPEKIEKAYKTTKTVYC